MTTRSYYKAVCPFVKRSSFATIVRSRQKRTTRHNRPFIHSVIVTVAAIITETGVKKWTKWINYNSEATQTGPDNWEDSRLLMLNPEYVLTRIYLLHQFEVVRAGRSLKVADWTRRKAAALLQRLALEQRLLKEQAIDFLWPAASLTSGANNLYRTIHALRQTLNDAFGDGAADATFSFSDGILALHESVWVDAHEFERLCQGQSTAADLQTAIDLYRGDLLSDDPYSDWLSPHRERLRRLYRENCLALSDVYGQEQEYSRALSLLSRLLNNDPADETAHRARMRLLALSGRRHEALRQYQACVDTLAAELDVSPAPETTAMYTQILSGELAPQPAAIQPLPVVSPPPADKARPLFVGRERELGVLEAHLQAAVTGNGRVLFITGEAGQGKTNLMAEFAYRALVDHPELVAAAGVCQALTGVADPYLPFRDLVAMLSGDWHRPWLGGDMFAAHVRRLQTIAPQTSQIVAAHTPDLVDIIAPAALSSLRASPLALQPPRSRNLSQRQIFDQTTQLFRFLAQRQPLLLLLDDLQWADIASASLLFHLGRQLVNSAVLIVGAYRPSEIGGAGDAGHPLAAVVQELVRYRGEIQIDLDTLVPAEGRYFVDALLDSEPNRLDATFREAMFRRTKGHPLFTMELLSALQEQGDLVQDESGMWTAVPNLDWNILPVRVEAVIARRVDRLPPELRQLLAVASVEGESFSAEVVAQVQGMAIRSLLHQLSQELDRRYRLVREQGEMRLGSQSVTRYHFRHNLFQQYLYHQLSAAERRQLHGEIAAALELIGGDDLEGLAVSLAHHTLAAGDATRSVPHLCRAGDQARRRVALEEAIHFYESALSHWQEDDAAAQAELLHKLGETLLALGRSQAAMGHFAEAEKLYAQVGNRSGMGAMQRLIGRSYWEQGNRAQATSHYQKALTLLEQEPEGAELARATSAIAQMHMLADESDEALAWSEQALALAQRLGTEDVVAHALTTLGISVVAKGDAERGLALLAESLAQAEALGLPHDVGRAYTGLGDSLLRLERYGEARAVYERLLAYARTVQAEMFEGVALAHLGYIDWWSGRWRAALEREQTIQEWMATSAALSISNVWASNLLAEMYNDLGQLAQARSVLAGYTAVARDAHELQTTVPHLAQLARAAQSEPERAGLVQEMLVLLDAAAYARYDALSALRLACAWLAQTSGGDTAALKRLEKAHAHLQNGHSAASLHEVRAVAAAIRGEWAQAVADYEAAAENWGVLQRPYDLLRTLAGLGPALTHTAETAAANHVQQQTSALIAQLAAELAGPELKQAFLASPLVIGIRRRSL
jgi:DNA-binding SARP family transcriptional activator